MPPKAKRAHSSAPRKPPPPSPPPPEHLLSTLTPASVPAASKRAKPPLPPPLQTRRSNKNAHPGEVDKPTKRRSSEAVRAEREERAALKAKQAEQHAEAISAVAAFEDSASQAFIEAQQQGRNPPLKKSNPPRRARPQTSHLQDNILGKRRNLQSDIV